ncbi:MAG TPA: sigma-70 family RNA polymerase sigma factor [Streptosporangiaceae bacterium]|nr:sigma-70 family RNA polymerase sigma factor [Streptosporangiaceae bacterium]
MSPDDTGLLVRGAADGDETAWRGLVTRFSGLVWAVARAHRLTHADAADVYQTTWLRLAEHIGRIEHPDRIGAWLATAARRECLQSLRSAAKAAPTDDMDRLDIAPAVGNPTEEAVLAAETEREDAARAAAMWRAFGQLSGRCRELLRILMATPPPSYAEVAAALGLPLGSIGPTRARCLQRLREEMAGIRDGLSPSS